MKSLTKKQFHWDRLPARHFKIDRLEALEADTNSTEARFRETFPKIRGTAIEPPVHLALN